MKKPVYLGQAILRLIHMYRSTDTITTYGQCSYHHKNIIFLVIILILKHVLFRLMQKYLSPVINCLLCALTGNLGMSFAVLILFMKPKYGGNLKLCYMDTYLPAYHIKTEDFYKDIARDVNPIKLRSHLHFQDLYFRCELDHLFH